MRTGTWGQEGDNQSKVGSLPQSYGALHGKAAVILGSRWCGNMVTYCIVQGDTTKCEIKHSPTSWWNPALPCPHTH